MRVLVYILGIAAWQAFGILAAGAVGGLYLWYELTRRNGDTL